MKRRKTPVSNPRTAQQSKTCLAHEIQERRHNIEAVVIRRVLLLWGWGLRRLNPSKEPPGVIKRFLKSRPSLSDRQAAMLALLKDVTPEEYELDRRDDDPEMFDLDLSDY